MVFSSPLFLFFYLPAVLLVYYMTPLRWRNAVLLVFNLIFYGWGEPVYILIMFLSIAIDYTHGMLVERAKRRGRDGRARAAVCSSVLFNLALLFFFKYWDFLAESLAAVGLDFMPRLGLSLPIGISFYTFQTMSYTIDVYRGDAPVQRSVISFGTFVTLFPQLIAGPIIQYKDLDAQLDHRDHTAEKFASGVQVFVVGMAKKVLLANNLGMLWDAYKAVPAAGLTVLGAWLGVAAFSLQIYFDFSGYSDMAIGLGRMLGFEFKPNFDYPYISRSITEFWRRWHISLGTWFREYVYIPLGGNRVSRGRLCFNLLVVWGLTGIWHGASWNFIAWGLYYFVLLTIEKNFLLKYLKKGKVWPHIYTLFFVVLGWGIFTANQPGAPLGLLLQKLFVPQGGISPVYYLRNYGVLLVLGCVCSSALPHWLWEKISKNTVAKLLVFALLTALCVCYVVAATNATALYANF